MKDLSRKIRMKSLFLCILILGFGLSYSFGQTKVDKLDQLFEKYTEYEQFNGSALVAQNGKVIFKKGFGMANMEWDIPNKANTKHRLGSITKQFTAMLILQLMEEGKIKLEASITDYLPDYPKDKGDVVTIHHLLTHTSGIPSYTSYPKFMKEISRDPYSPEDFTRFFADSTLQFKPGSTYRYNNSGYFILGVIIEKLTGKSYEEALRERIFKPLNMMRSGFDHHRDIVKNRATGYEKRGERYINAPYLDMSLPYAAGSIYSTVEDLYLWDQALYTNKLLTKESMALFFGKHMPTGQRYYAYGWSVGPQQVGSGEDSVYTISHGGGINGFNTIINRIPEDKHLVVLLNNTGGTNLGDMNKAITAILYEKAYDMPKKSLAKFLRKLILDKNLKTGLSWYETNKSSNTYALKENEMNQLGYQFLQMDKTEAAIAIFKMNVEGFPKSSNAYDSLGEAYMKAGNKELAIKNYKKSVELNPNNKNAVAVIQKLESGE
ncbi:serine hydrolase [Ancylomarina sp. YFZ004]